MCLSSSFANSPSLRFVATEATLTGPGRRDGIPGVASEHVFVDEWDVAAPPDAVFAAVADGRTYPEWWRPVYLLVDGDDAPAVGASWRHLFRGRLRKKLRLTTRVASYEPPRRLELEIGGDLHGRGLWTFTPRDGGTHVRWEWHMDVDRPLLRYLGPLMRPLFRWNHRWTVARAREGLERRWVTAGAGA
jgi:uncharacterized protein YndB with AHSA1/START domain